MRYIAKGARKVFVFRSGEQRIEEYFHRDDDEPSQQFQCVAVVKPRGCDLKWPEKQLDHVSIPPLIGGPHVWTTKEVESRVSEAFGLLGDQPGLPLEFRAPHDVEPIGTVNRKGQRANVRLTGPTEYRRRQEALGELEYDASEAGHSIVARDPRDGPGPRNFGEMVTIGEIFAEFADPDADDADDGDDAYAGVLSGVHIR